MKPEDIAGKTVGGQKGTSQLAQLKAFAAKLPKPVEVKEYVDNNQSYADLAAGRIDATRSIPSPTSPMSPQQRPDTFAVVTPPFGQPTYFSWVGRLDDKSADRRDQRRDRQDRGDGTMAKSRRHGSARRWTCRRRSPSPKI